MKIHQLLLKVKGIGTGIGDTFFFLTWYWVDDKFHLFNNKEDVDFNFLTFMSRIHF